MLHVVVESITHFNVFVLLLHFVVESITHFNVFVLLLHFVVASRATISVQLNTQSNTHLVTI